MASVLVVEDDSAVRRLVAAVLGAAGHQVLQAAAIGEALAVLEDLGSAVDLVISDIGLPDGSGARVMLLCRQLRPEVTVLFMTGSTEEHPALLHEVEPWRILDKPFRAARLVEAVQRALGESAGGPRDV